MYVCIYCTPKASWSFNQSLSPILVFSGLLMERKILQAEHLNPFAVRASEMFWREHSIGGSCINHWKSRVRICFFIKRKQAPKSVPSKTVFAFIAFNTEKGESLLKDFWNWVSYLANFEGWIFQDLSTSYTTKWASDFLKAAQFCKHGLNFEHFCLPALFNLISLTDMLSLVIILPPIPFLCHTQIYKNKTKTFPMGVSPYSF